MGSTLSTPFSKDLENFTIEKEDPENNSKLIRHNKNLQEFMIKELSYNDERQFDKKKEIYLSRRKMDKSQHLTTLIRFQTVKEDHLCSHFYKIYTMWQYPHRTLRQELNDRILHQQRFQEKQLWSILASCILGLSDLQRHGIKHQSLQTKTLLLGMQGFLKIADPLCLSINTNFQTMYNNRQAKDIYLSPQQGAQLTATSYSIPSSPYKSDVFTTAMILLQCGLLKSQNNCYREDGGRIDWGVIGQNLNEFSKYYQQGLRSAIQAMLRRDHRERPDWIDLQKHVRKIQGQDSIDMDLSQFKKSQQQNQRKQQQTSNISTYVQKNKQHMTFEENTYKNGVKNIHNLHPAYSDYQPLPPLISTNFNYTTPFLPQSANTNYNHYLNFKEISSNVNQIPTRYDYYQYPSIPTQYPKIDSTYNNYKSSFQNKSYISKLSPQKNYLPQAPYQHSQKTPQQIYSTYNYNYQTGINLCSNIDSRPKYLSSPKKYTQNSYENQYESKTYEKLVLRPWLNQGQSTKLYNNSSQKYQCNDENQLSGTHYSPYNASKKDRNILNQENKVRTLPYRNAISNYQSLQTSNSMVKNTLNNLYFDDVGSNLNISQSNKYLNKYSPTKNFIQKQPQNYPLRNLSNHIQNIADQALKPINQSKQKEKIENQDNQIINNSNMQDQQQKSINIEEGLQYVVQKFEQGSSYQGTKFNGMRHGKGKFYYQDGGLYDGQWCKNKMHGYGCLYYQSGKIAYEGYWNSDQFQGQGKLFNENAVILEEPFDYTNFDMIDQFWVNYQGQFDEDLKQGKGKMILSNNEQFNGTFENDMINGQGWYSCKDGKIIHGYWESNQLVKVFDQ